jgi:DNA-binding SARP family transcriptional activator/tetratricopeptide (TPR) repeat protein
MNGPSTSLARSQNGKTNVFLRISTLGPFQIDWFDPATEQATPLPPGRLQGQNAGSALGLLKALLSSPNRFATRAWLNEQFWPTSKQKSAEERLNDVVSSLRTLLRPVGCTDMLVHFVYGTNGRGAGFRLDAYPHLWCDADAFEWYVKHAMLLDQRGQDSTACWERAFLLGERGIYLPEQIEEDWSRSRRDYLQGLLRDCIHHWTTLLRQKGYVDEAIMRLRSYWLEHPTDEDSLRPLLEMLGQCERFGEAEEYYEKARGALAEDGHVFDRHTQEAIEVVRALQIRRVAGTHYAIRIEEEAHIIEADPLLENGQRMLPPLISSPSSPSLATQQLHHLDAPQAASSSSHYRYIPYVRNPFFTGREDIISHLYQLLHTKGEAVALTQYALCGLGGVGKTQIVLEYAYRYGGDYQAIFWAKADSQENLLADFLMIARILHLSEQFAEDRSVTTTAVKQWFQLHDRWLLILDNVDDWTFVSAFLPSDHRGHILLTTRMQALGGFAYGCCVEEMNEETGTHFLLRRSGFLSPGIASVDQTSDEYVFAQKLVKEVGGLPLALDQAGAYIEETASSLQEYLDMYHAYRLELLQRRGGLTPNHPESVLTTWKVAFTQIEKHNIVATHILRLCAVLDPDAIPEELLLTGIQQVMNASDATSPLVLSEAVSVLLRFSLVRRNGKTRTLTIHRLVQAVIWDALDETQQRHYAHAAIQTLVVLFPHTVAVENWPQCQRFFPHVQKLLIHTEWHSDRYTEVGILCNQLGYYLREQALYQEAEKVYQKGLIIREQLLGREHADTAQIYYNLARLYFDTGQYALSIQFHQQALAIREKTLAPEDLQIALSLNSLAFTYYTQGMGSTEIEALFLRALSIYEQTIGREHPITSHCLSNLALFYASQKRFGEAEQLLLQVQSIREMHLPPIHLDTARSLQNLAWLYLFQEKKERYEEVRKLLERSLAIRQDVLGTEHPQVAISLHNLALLSEAEEKMSEAEYFYQQVLVIRQKSLGPANAKVMLVQRDYANLLRKMGREMEAVVLEAQGPQ